MHKTNTEFVTELMTYSDHGALSQIFIIDAIRKHAERVAAADPTTIDSDFISGERWVGVAREIKRKLDANYGTSAEDIPNASA